MSIGGCDKRSAAVFVAPHSADEPVGKMSFVSAAPEILQSAATDLGSIGSTINTANAAAAAPTTQVLAAGADEVSAAIATVFLDPKERLFGLYRADRAGGFHRSAAIIGPAPRMLKARRKL